MKEMKFYGKPLPNVEIEPYSGKLIVIEGTDGVGRSTHVALLRTWLESIGYAVLDTGMTRSVRSEEHTSELQSRLQLVCRLLLEKKNNLTQPHRSADCSRSNGTR